MTIANGSPATPDDFITADELSDNSSEDKGKVAKLNSDAEIDTRFLEDEVLVDGDTRGNGDIIRRTYGDNRYRTRYDMGRGNHSVSNDRTSVRINHGLGREPAKIEMRFANTGDDDLGREMAIGTWIDNGNKEYTLTRRFDDGSPSPGFEIRSGRMAYFSESNRDSVQIEMQNVNSNYFEIEFDSNSWHSDNIEYMWIVEG